MSVEVKCNAAGCDTVFENPKYNSTINDADNIMFDMGNNFHVCDKCILLAFDILKGNKK